ncbi:MAG: hypothetical protein PVH68_14665 [Armatimonadota bacterium]|jgi:hypothetical protein
MPTDWVREILYGVIVAAFWSVSAIEAWSGEWKYAVTAGLFGLANGVIFFWRP